MSNKQFTAILIAVAVLSAASGFYLRLWITQDTRPSNDTAEIQQTTQAQQQTQTKQQITKMGDAAPSLRLPDTNQVLQDLKQWQGKTIMLNFWASWCTPCREELPILVELQDKYQDQGLQLVGVALDSTADAQAMAEEFAIQYPILVADEMAGIALMSAFANRTGAMPYTVVIDKQGNLAASHKGAVDIRLAEAMILPLL